MKEQDDKLWDLIKGIGGVVGLLLVAWMSWVSYTLVNIELAIDDLNGRVPKKKTSLVTPSARVPQLADPTLPFVRTYEETKR